MDWHTHEIHTSKCPTNKNDFTELGDNVTYVISTDSFVATPAGLTSLGQNLHH